MERPNEDRPDNLEIASIGALYNGPLDKKYWSCSRGKDRYPYPVGYQAVRTHNGSTFKMEIHEGLKGPLFVINSIDGHACSGQTPGIAWESFQKKGCSYAKMWHGKRSTRKMDGVEFFGFRNPFVQRLLRELVANVNGTAESSLSLHSFCNGASRKEHDTECSDLCICPDLLPFLARQHITRKRSRQHKIKNVKLNDGARQKRIRPQDQMCNGDASKFREMNWKNKNVKNSTTLSASHEEYDICNQPKALPASMNLETVVEEAIISSVQDGLLLESTHAIDPVKVEGFLSHGDGKCFDSENCETTNIANSLSSDKEPLDRLQDAEVKGFNSLITAEDKDGGALFPNGSPEISPVNLCVPDTLDPLLDNPSSSAPTNPKEGPQTVKDGLTAPEALVTESHPEEEIDPFISNPCSERSDFDSDGHEIAKSMMTVLLPQALPLLKKFYRKGKKGSSLSEVSHFEVKSMEENNEISHLVDSESTGNVKLEDGMIIGNFCAERETMVHFSSTDLSSVPPNSEHVNYVIPDSFENDICGNNIPGQFLLISDIADAGQTIVDEEICTPDNFELLGGVNAQKKSSVGLVETSDSKEVFCCDEAHKAPNEMPQRGCIVKSESALGRSSSSTKFLIGRSEDVPQNHGSSELIQKDCEDLDSEPKGTGGTLIKPPFSFCTCVQLLNDDNVSKVDERDIQIPDIVTSTKKLSGPLSESIICRNFQDECIPKTCTSGALLASGINSIPNKRVSFEVGTGFDGLPHSLYAETTVNSDGIVYNKAPVTSQTQFVSATKEKDISDSFDPTVRFVRKSEDHIVEKLVGVQNTVEFNSSAQMIQDNKMCDAKEVQAASHLEPHENMGFNNELDDIADLVGCYVHPMPISCVLLCAKGNEICICVLCGRLIDGDGTLFLYKVSLIEPKTGCPSFVGHASVRLLISKDNFDIEIAMDRSCLQFTPDGQCLVFVNNLKAPYCREQKIDCPCVACASVCYEGNSIKIVQVQLGYVLVQAKLRIADSVHCILVCGPDHLVAVEENGILRLWVMNTTWSAPVEEFVIPSYACIFPCIVELKRIPKCNNLIVGHNGFGEFGLWDILSRTLISRFSASRTSVLEFFPISLFSWQRKSSFPGNTDMDEHINRIMDATKISFSEHSESNDFLPSEREDMAIWLLVSSVSNCDAQHNSQSSDSHRNPIGQWKLALLVKNMVILGSPLDPRASAIGTSAGHGIVGTLDGLVYMWEISTGTQLGTLHHFKGCDVSCIAVDDSRLPVVTIAGGGGELLVYLLCKQKFEN